MAKSASVEFNLLNLLPNQLRKKGEKEKKNVNFQ